MIILISFQCGCNSGVECKLPKLDVTGSNPVARSFFVKQKMSEVRPAQRAGQPAFSN